jgi:hypothetical protein
LPGVQIFNHDAPTSPPRHPYSNQMARPMQPAKPPKPEKPAKPVNPIRETIKYPTIDVTDANDSCLNPSLTFEHVLLCGHLVTTALPNEPCAPNCHHAADGEAEFDHFLKYKKEMKMKNGKTISDNEFYCDACVETEVEIKIPAGFSSANADERRAMLRTVEAKTRKKATKFRKCYIAMKITSVQCHSDGEVSSRHVPRKERHPFDTAMPRSGENMFEDVDPTPKEDEEEAVVMAMKKTVDTIDLDANDWDDSEADDAIAVARAPRKSETSPKNSRSTASIIAPEVVSDEDNHETTLSSRPKRRKRLSRAARDAQAQAPPKRKSYFKEVDDDDETDREEAILPNGYRLGTPIAMIARQIPKKKPRKRLVRVEKD